MDEVLTLIRQIWRKDSRGATVLDHEEERDVFCRVRSIGRSEFFDAGRNGLNPEFEFVVFAGDYLGELLCEFNGSRYAIYRTYRDIESDYIELYVERKGGTNG